MEMHDFPFWQPSAQFSASERTSGERVFLYQNGAPAIGFKTFLHKFCKTYLLFNPLNFQVMLKLCLFEREICLVDYNETKFMIISFLGLYMFLLLPIAKSTLIYLLTQ